MPNLLHLLGLRPRHVEPRGRRRVALPDDAPRTDAVFLVLRRVRRPLLVMLGVFVFCTAGMALMPGPPEHPEPMSLFDAFYQMSITVTTVGFGEFPHTYSYQQRMWQVLCIFLLVVSWAYTIGVLFAMMQEPAFIESMAVNRFRRHVRHLREPFVIIAGFGQTGRTVGLELDQNRRRFVVVDHSQAKVESLLTQPLSVEVPALESDCRRPSVLTMAGLGHPYCQGVLALTDDDEANLAVVMAVSLLRPELPVIARCTDRDTQFRMEDFRPEAVINPNDRYGGYLALTLHKPVTYQLLTWLMDNDEHELPPLRAGLTDGRWLVCGDGDFANEVVRDLRRSGLEADLIDPDDAVGPSSAVGFVAGTDNDYTNIALAEHIRLTNPRAYLSVRQQSGANAAVLAALDTDSTFVPTDLVAREVLARVVTPRFWSFLENAIEMDDAWSVQVRDLILERCGTATPERDIVILSQESSPAIARWLGHSSISIADLMRHPDDRDTDVAAVALMLTRGEDHILFPPDDTTLRLGDEILVAGTPGGLDDMSEALFSDATVEYVATGELVPSNWFWRVLTRRRRGR